MKVCLRPVKWAKQRIIRSFPGICKPKIRNYFWCWFLAFVIIGCIVGATVLSLVLSQVSAKKLPELLSFDSSYSLILNHPSDNQWTDLTVNRRAQLIKDGKLGLFSLSPAFKYDYKSLCIRREDYIFEFLRIFGINPHKENLKTDHVFVIGAHTSIGRAVVNELSRRNISYLGVNGFDFMDFGNAKLKKVLNFVNISKCIICDTTPRYRHAMAENDISDKGDSKFFPALIQWASSRQIKLVFAKLPHRSKAYKILKDGKATIVEVPYFVDSSYANDPYNVLPHMIAECGVFNQSFIDVDPEATITGYSGADIAKAIIDEQALPEAPESVKVETMAKYISHALKCNISFRRSHTVDPESTNVPKFVSNATHTPIKRSGIYTSIVVVGRHDGFSKGFEKRTQNFFDAIANNTMKVPLANYEIIFVDYATPIETTKMSETVRIHPALSGRVRFINVPTKAHIRLCRELNTSISFLEYVAKNIGTRRARGRYVLTTNPDDLIGVDFFDQLEREEFNDGILYRTNRWSGNEHTEQKHTAEELLEALNNPQLLSSFDLAARCPTHMTGSSWELSAAAIAEDAWPCGAGDFLMLSREMWFAIQGFNEFPGNANIDAVFIGKIMKIVPGYIRYWLRTPIVHQYHPRQNIFRPSVRDHEEHMKKYACRGDCPGLGRFQDTENWGLGDEVFPEDLF